MNSRPVALWPVGSLMGSNLRVTCAWHGHLQTLADRPWLMPAPIGRVSALAVFVPFAMLCLERPFKLDRGWAGPGLVGETNFILRH